MFVYWGMFIDVTNPDDIGSPRRLLREAIVNVIALKASPETLTFLKNSRRKWERVQNSHGKGLTTS